MRKEKFIYNTHTLRYEKVEESLSSKLLRVFGFVCAAVFTAFIFTVISHRYFPSPKEKAQLREIEKLKAELVAYENTLDLLSEELGVLQQRDAYAHRVIYGMEPIDEGVWEGGIGGHDQLEQYRQYKNTGTLMASVDQKINKLKRQMVIQSKSLDTILTRANEKEKMFAAIPSIKPVRSDKLKYGRSVVQLSGFGMRIHPVLKRPKMHYGIDFTAKEGTPIYATGAGKVIRNEYSRTYGNYVEIDHGFGYRSLYAHMSSSDVKVGQTVTRGQHIGAVGSTGRSTAPHCHYEVFHNGIRVNPIHYCMDGLTPEEYQSLVEAAESPNQAFDYVSENDTE